MAARIPIPITPEAFSKKKKTEHHHEVELPLVDDNEVTPGGDNNNNDDGEPLLSSETTTHKNEDDDEEEEDDDEISLEEHAMIVTAILKPVGITMFIVVWIVYALNMAAAPPTHISFMLYNESSSDPTYEKLGGSILNALIFVVLIVLVTFILVILYKYRCIKLIFAWLIAATGMLLAFFGGALYLGIVLAYSVPLDWITFFMVVWNFMVAGMIAIFWYSPTKVTQAYLIAISALLACFFTRLPEWTTWAILVAVAIYDLFAVLCPRGPLKILVDLSHERQEPIPALLYNGSVSCMADYDFTEDSVDTILPPPHDRSTLNDDGDNVVDNDSTSAPPLLEVNDNSDDRGNLSLPTRSSSPSSSSEDDRIIIETEDDPEKRSVKLGLGDFVFYSVLMGRAALYDITTVFTCFIAIITGLFFTLILLAIFKKALPALPISILLGTIFFVLTEIFLVPFVLLLGTNSIFI